MEHKDGAWGPTAHPGPLPALLGALCTELTLSSTQAQGSSSIPQPPVSKDQKLSCTHRTGRVGEVAQELFFLTGKIQKLSALGSLRALLTHCHPAHSTRAHKLILTSH